MGFGFLWHFRPTFRFQKERDSVAKLCLLDGVHGFAFKGVSFEIQHCVCVGGFK